MIPLYKPYVPKLPELDQIIHSGQLAAGEYTQEFEKKLKEYISCNSVLATSAFNTAVSIVIAAFDLKPGDEIIVSPMACLASTQPYATAGLKIVWADIDPHTGSLDPESVEEHVTCKTKAIIHNHFCGYPGYIDEINDIGRKNEILVIDDGIECFGTKYKGKLIGNCGTEATVFSFNPVRVLTTVDGGAVVFRDHNILEKASLIRDCGIDRSIFRDELGEINPKCDIKMHGFSATLSNVNSYIGIRQFLDLEKRITIQRKQAGIWNDTIHDYGNYKPLSSCNGEPNYWVYGILADDKKECIRKFRELGYYASGVHINNNIYSIFGKEKTLPGVAEFYNSFVALPCGWWMDEDFGNGVNQDN